MKVEEPVSAIEREYQKYKERVVKGEQEYLKSFELRQSIDYYQGHGISQGLNNYMKKIMPKKEMPQKVEEPEKVDIEEPVEEVQESFRPEKRTLDETLNVMRARSARARWSARAQEPIDFHDAADSNSDSEPEHVS